MNYLCNEAMIKKLDQVTQNAISENRIVGSVVLVAHQGQLVYQKAAGLADRENNQIMSENAIFLLASLTKPMVSVAAMKLIEEEKLSLNDPVTKYLPAFRPKMIDGSTPDMTIFQLLTHTAGLSYSFWEANGIGPYNQAEISDGFDKLGISLEENLNRLQQAPLLFQPGSSWCYSLALDVLGAIMSIAVNESLPQIIHSRVTKPLGLRDTGFSVTNKTRLNAHYTDAAPQPERMRQYAQVQLPESWGSGMVRFAPERIFDSASYPSGGAGMAGTAPDFMRFLLALTRKNGAILPANTVDQMMFPQVSAQAQTQGPGWGFGFGWAVLDDPQLAQTPQSKGTIQWGGVYGHTWFYDPVQDIAVVTLTNTAVEGMAGMYPVQIRDAVYGL